MSEVVCDRAESLVHLCRCLYASLYNRFCKLDKLSNLVRRCVLVLKVSQLSAENVDIGAVVYVEVDGAYTTGFRVFFHHVGVRSELSITESVLPLTGLQDCGYH